MAACRSSTFSAASGEGGFDENDRVSVRDEQRLKEIDELTDPSAPPTVTHWLAPPVGRSN